MDELKQKRLEKAFKNMRPSPVIDEIKYLMASHGKKIEYVTLEPGSDTSLDPFDIEENEKEANIFGLRISVINKLKNGGFENLAEVAKLINKFDKGDFKLRNILNEWYLNDCTKIGLLKLINELSLD